MSISQGKFIAFEGLDGSGASTQINLLAKKFMAEGKKIVTTKEPTNGLIGGLARGVLQHIWQTSPETLQLLFAADRGDHLYREILPAKEDGKIVISDRYFFSTFAFGSIYLPLDWLKNINANFPIPDLTILLKVSPKVCLERIGNSSRAGFEFFEEQKKLEKTWETYELLAQNKKNNMVIVDGERTIDEIASEIYQIVSKKI